MNSRDKPFVFCRLFYVAEHILTTRSISLKPQNAAILIFHDETALKNTNARIYVNSGCDVNAMNCTKC